MDRASACTLVWGHSIKWKTASLDDLGSMLPQAISPSILSRTTSCTWSPPQAHTWYPLLKVWTCCNAHANIICYNWRSPVCTGYTMRALYNYIQTHSSKLLPPAFVTPDIQQTAAASCHGRVNHPDWSCLNPTYMLYEHIYAHMQKRACSEPPADLGLHATRHPRCQCAPVRRAPHNERCPLRAAALACPPHEPTKVTTTTDVVYVHVRWGGDM